MAYVAYKRGWVEDELWPEESGLIPDLSVPGPKTTDTGLVDLQGRRIYRTQPPIGFGRDREW